MWSVVIRIQSTFYQDKLNWVWHVFLHSLSIQRFYYVFEQQSLAYLFTIYFHLTSGCTKYVYHFVKFCHYTHATQKVLNSTHLKFSNYNLTSNVMSIYETISFSNGLHWCCLNTDSPHWPTPAQCPVMWTVTEAVADLVFCVFIKLCLKPSLT